MEKKQAKAKLAVEEKASKIKKSGANSKNDVASSQLAAPKVVASPKKAKLSDGGSVEGSKKPEVDSGAKSKSAVKADVAAAAIKGSAKPGKLASDAKSVKPTSSEKEVTGKKIKIRQIASGAGRLKKQQATLRGLGLKRVSMERELEDTPSVRGMINSVKHLVIVVE